MAQTQCQNLDTSIRLDIMMMGRCFGLRWSWSSLHDVLMLINYKLHRHRHRFIFESNRFFQKKSKQLVNSRNGAIERAVLVSRISRWGWSMKLRVCYFSIDSSVCWTLTMSVSLFVSHLSRVYHLLMSFNLSFAIKR